MKAITRRLIPEGMPNPNLGKPYKNMNEKLNDYFELFKNKVPVVIRDEEDFEGKDMIKLMSINPTKIIGYAIKFSDTHIILDIQEDKEEFFKSVPNPRIEILTVIDRDNIIERVVKLGLTSKGE